LSIEQKPFFCCFPLSLSLSRASTRRFLPATDATHNSFPQSWGAQAAKKKETKEKDRKENAFFPRELFPVSFPTVLLLPTSTSSLFLHLSLRPSSRPCSCSSPPSSPPRAPARPLLPSASRAAAGSATAPSRGTGREERWTRTTAPWSGLKRAGPTTCTGAAVPSFVFFFLFILLLQSKKSLQKKT